MKFYKTKKNIEITDSYFPMINYNYSYEKAMEQRKITVYLAMIINYLSSTQLIKLASLIVLLASLALIINAKK